MSRGLQFLFILPLAFPLIGCSSSNTTSNTGATCNAAAPCGGALDGTWTITSVCVEGNLTAALNQQLVSGQGLPTACGNTFQTAVLDGSGTVTFANGTETDNVTETMDVTLTYTAACESAVAKQTVTMTASICATIQQTLTGTTNGFTTANCSLSNGACACTASRETQAPTAAQPYTVSGSTITYSGTNASEPTDYCVSATTLSARQPLAGLDGITVASVLQKQ